MLVSFVYVLGITFGGKVGLCLSEIITSLSTARNDPLALISAR